LLFNVFKNLVKLLFSQNLLSISFSWFGNGKTVFERVFGTSLFSLLKTVLTFSLSSNSFVVLTLVVLNPFLASPSSYTSLMIDFQNFMLSLAHSALGLDFCIVHYLTL
jgi:uncharacterized membrane protein